MSFQIKRADGSARAVSGYKYAAPKLGSKSYTGERLGATALPPKVDLRQYMTKVEDQENTNSCTANAVAGAYEYLVKRYMGEKAYDVSRLFIYYNARSLDESEELADEGSVIGLAIEGLKQYGACSEETWPFETDSVNEEPSSEAYEEASEFVIEDTELVPTDLDAWRRCLAEGYPIIFGLSLYNSFDSHRKKGLVSMPSSAESSRGTHSGHAMLCVGYSDTDKVFIVRNSWGHGWGDKGYCYIPYRYIINEDWNGGDSWIIRRLETLEQNEETWGDDTPVVEELHNDIAEMDDETHGAFLEAMGEHPLETRLALLFFAVAGADEEITEEEGEAISGYLSEAMESLGSELSPQKVLKQATRLLGSDKLEKLLEQTIEIFGEYLSKAALAGLVSKLEEVVGTDELSDDEAGFLDTLIEAWQVAEGEGGEEEEEDEEAEEDEGEGEEE
jgi:hypothetical protein